MGVPDDDDDDEHGEKNIIGKWSLMDGVGRNTASWYRILAIEGSIVSSVVDVARGILSVP